MIPTKILNRLLAKFGGLENLVTVIPMFDSIEDKLRWMYHSLQLDELFDPDFDNPAEALLTLECMVNSSAAYELQQAELSFYLTLDHDILWLISQNPAKAGIDPFDHKIEFIGFLQSLSLEQWQRLFNETIDQLCHSTLTL